jgi:sulfur-carrier protein adenylyltransferase/sulfurtransferase
MMAGKGFDTLYNMSGGIKAWTSNTAFGPEDMGLELFSGTESVAEVIVVAYSLEDGLRDFYLTMDDKTGNPDVKALFQKLAAIEVKHKERLFKAYLEATGETQSVQEFESGIVASTVEGGLTTKEYVDRFQPDFESEIDIISLAMSIEAQALDLYERAADNTGDENSKAVLKQIAGEELAHLSRLGELMDEVVR